MVELKELKVELNTCLCDLPAAQVNLVPVLEGLELFLKRVAHWWVEVGRQEEGKEEEEEEEEE